ncbi:MAG: tetratricopeptide repeat protein [Gemmatimonadota bacterium]
MSAGHSDWTPARETARQAIARAEALTQAEQWPDALVAYGEALELAGDGEDSLPVRADARRGRAIVLVGMADWSAAEEDAGESRRLAAASGDAGRLGRAVNILAAVAYERGDWSAARHHYAAARTHALAAGDAGLAAQIENNEGTLWAARGERWRAEACFRRALEQFEALENHPCGARALNNLGMVLVAQGRMPEAAVAYDRALGECKRRGDSLLAVKVMINRARLALLRDNPLQAHATAMTAWTFARRLGDGPVAAGSMCLLGEVARALNDRVGATRCLKRALRHSAAGKAPLVEAETWVQIGCLYRDQEQPERAADAWRHARLLYLSLGATREAERMGDRIDALREAMIVEPSVLQPTGTHDV